MRTDERGYFSRSGLPPGIHGIRVYKREWGSSLVVTPERVELTETTGEVELRVAQPREVAIKLLFVDSDRRPIALESGYWSRIGRSGDSHRLPGAGHG